MIINATPNDYPHLTSIWESAVRATHHFLQPEDITYYKERLPLYFAQVDLYIYKEDNNIQGFIGVSDEEIEMLFVDNVYRGKGIGNSLTRFAIEHLNVHYVTVNEDNHQAEGFYRHWGFEVINRSVTDSDGKPYPLLYMKRD